MTANFSNMTTWQGFLNMANENSAGYFWTLLGCYLPFIIATVVLLPFGWEVAIVIGAFIGIILSALLSYAGLVAWWVVGSFIGIEIFMILYIFWSNRYDQ
jgi:hypothetical protein